MEVTLTELWLFVWGLLSSLYALKREAENRMHLRMLHAILVDKQARVRILRDFDETEERINASKS